MKTKKARNSWWPYDKSKYVSYYHFMMACQQIKVGHPCCKVPNLIFEVLDNTLLQSGLTKEMTKPLVCQSVFDWCKQSLKRPSQPSIHSHKTNLETSLKLVFFLLPCLILLSSLPLCGGRILSGSFFSWPGTSITLLCHRLSINADDVIGCRVGL